MSEEKSYRVAPEVTDKIALEHGLTEHEYELVQGHLGRVPTFEELGVFSVMWSEHCSYKSSRAHLKRFPTEGPRVLQGPGENAGGIDIGGGMAAIFKIESHNHPSYIEPYQGAATGVGGILRDIFTMGARPVANMNSLRFGSAGHEKTPFLLNGVVAGIAGYGNSVGVATIGGETHFDEGYDGNILVNAFTLGIVAQDRIFRAKAAGTGNPILYVGSKTGRDGIHGASLLASSEFKEESEQMKPTVQVGDPFTENLLIEACLEVMSGDDVVAIQDMGAAGLTSSSVEMASRGEVGIEMDLDKIPLRDESLSPYEMLLSESQERMVLVVRQGAEERVGEIFSRWGLDCVAIGHVTDDGKFRASYRGEEVCAIPVDALTDAAPVYERPVADAPPAVGPPLDESGVDVPGDLGATLTDLLAGPNLCSKRWVYEQYDSYVGANTMVQPGGDAAVVRVRETGGALAMSCDCNSRYVALDPFVGAQHAVAETARNIAVTGGRAAAMSDCLNFGSPEKPEIMNQFSRAIDGMVEACNTFETPVISGNVSFYNDTLGASIPPSPVVAMVGLVNDAEKTASVGLKRGGGAVVLLGAGEPELTGSEYLKAVHGLTGDAAPRIDLAAEKALCELCVRTIESGKVDTAHDVADGGLAVALAEMILAGNGSGLDIAIDNPDGTRLDTLLFGESGARALVVIDPQELDWLRAQAGELGVPLAVIGTTGESGIRVSVGGKRCFEVDGDALAAGWSSTLERIAHGEN